MQTQPIDPWSDSGIAERVVREDPELAGRYVEIPNTERNRRVAGRIVAVIVCFGIALVVGLARMGA